MAVVIVLVDGSGHPSGIDDFQQDAMPTAAPHADPAFASKEWLALKGS